MQTNVALDHRKRMLEHLEQQEPKMAQCKSETHLQKFMGIARKAQETANWRGGDYASLTFDELCELMMQFDDALTKAEDAELA